MNLQKLKSLDSAEKNMYVGDKNSLQTDDYFGHLHIARMQLLQ